MNTPLAVEQELRDLQVAGAESGRGLAGEGPESAVMLGGEVSLELRLRRYQGQHPLAGAVEARPSPPRPVERGPARWSWFLTSVSPFAAEAGSQTNAPTPVMARPTIRVLISLV